jgi:high-affinity iron transporter
VQAATGMLAILVLLIVMNWFFHKLYWTGWISLHNQKKRELLSNEGKERSELRIVTGMALLGFTSFYREGFEVILFLQSYRLKLGNLVVLYGVIVGGLATCIVAVLTFVVHRHLPYRRMLVLTGLMLAFVLLVMVGEEAQEMQQAGWLSVTEVPKLVHLIPSWMGLWLSVFPTVETLLAQVIAAALVFGSYITARSLPGTAR